MKVLHAFLKEFPGTPTIACAKLSLVKGFGIAGDTHAAVGNPRQILLVGLPVLLRWGLQPGNLRENITVDSDIECLNSGDVLQFATGAAVRLTFRCEPCRYLETIRPGLMRQLVGQRGFLGAIVASGTVMAGEAIAVIPRQFPPLPDDAKGRFTEFIARIPYGKVASTRDLIQAIGVSRAYYRTIPQLVKSTPGDLPIHRLVSAEGRVLSQHIPNQVQMLLAEGVRCDREIVDPIFFWEAQSWVNFDWIPPHA